jgi:4'-phosphopantetheinyl transferase
MRPDSRRLGQLAGVCAKLPDGEAHVWYGAPVLNGEQFSTLEPTLSQQERERAGRFRFARDARRFIAARGFLRSVLSGYLGIAASEIEFHCGAAGKPELAALNPDGALRFNLSHSGDLVLVAVAEGRDVGVDVEMIRDSGAHEEVTARFFHPCEVAALASFPAAGRSLAFYRFWTRKEAYLKARGDGLPGGLATLDTSGKSGTPLGAVRFTDPLSADRSWCMFDFDPAPGYVAAVVVETRQ